MSKMTEEQLAKQRERRKANGNAAARRYEKTKNGFLMRTYRNMKSRVTGVQHKKAHLYQGLDILDKVQFYAWSLLDTEFHNLFEIWQTSGYDRKLTPSIDRINSAAGYVEGNIRWITHSQNSRLGNQSRFLSRTSIIR